MEVTYRVEFLLAADVHHLQPHLVDVCDELVDPGGGAVLATSDERHCVRYHLVVRTDEERVLRLPDEVVLCLYACIGDPGVV